MAEATDSQNERTRRAKQSMTAYTVQRGEFKITTTTAMAGLFNYVIMAR